MTRQERKEIRKARIQARNDRMKARSDAADEQRKRQAEAESAILKVPEGKPTIVIAMNCFFYQKRMCWMLSSILQQKGELPNIIVDVSYCPDNGSPKTEDVCNFFRGLGLDVRDTVVTEDEIKKRGVSRNFQVDKYKDIADWMLFVDADMVYSEYFFDDLGKQVVEKLAQCKKCIGADRSSLQIEHCVDYFDNVDENVYPCEIKNVAEVVSKWPVWYNRGRKVAAGYFQLANMEAIQRKGGIYSPPKRHDNIRTYKSDRNFRVIMGGRVGMQAKKQYHLNHSRDFSNKQR